MNNARNIEPALRLKAAQLNVEMGDWVHSLAEWQLISHLTFSWEASIWSAQRCYEKFMRTEMRGVSYFYALEQNPAAMDTTFTRYGVTARASHERSFGEVGLSVMGAIASSL